MELDFVRYLDCDKINISYLLRAFFKGKKEKVGVSVEKCNKENNFLFTGIGKGNIPTSVAKRLIKELKIDNAYATIYAGEDRTLFQEVIDIWDAFYGNYPKSENKEFIDRSYKNPIAQYSVEILHQMARHGNWDFEKRVNVYYAHLTFWDNFLETREINYVVFSWVPHESYDYIIYLLCKARQIKTCMCYADGLRYFITSKSIYMLNSVENHTMEVDYIYERLKVKYEDKSEDNIKLPEYAEKYFNEVKDRFEKADESGVRLLSKRRISMLKHDYGNPQETFKELKKGEKSIKDFYGSCQTYVRGVLRTKKLIKHYEDMALQPDISDKYFFYALHYQPECTSSPLGGVYANQLLAIQLLAHNLPKGYWLYVKEHPDQTAVCRNVVYYEELLKIPNVKLISQKVTSEKLIKNAVAVATLTGTVMFESQVLQKPCLCLGYSHMEVLNGVYKINTDEDCRKAINEIIAGQARVTTAKDLKLFWLAMGEMCFDTNDETEYYNKLLSYIDIKSS